MTCLPRCNSINRLQAFDLTKEAASCFDACLETKATASAANNAGNCYASLAEMASQDRNDQQLSQHYSQTAESRYRLALQHDPQDVEVREDAIGSNSRCVSNSKRFGKETHPLCPVLWHRLCRI